MPLVVSAYKGIHLCYVAAVAAMLITYLICNYYSSQFRFRKCREINLRIMTPEKKTVNLVYIPRNLTTIGGPWYFW